MNFATRLRAKVAMPIPPFLLHLGHREMAKARMGALYLVV